MSKKLTEEEFRKKVEDKYGNKYTYDFSEYKSVDHQLTFNCELHGSFKRAPYYFLKGQYCSFCKAQEDFIEKANKKYNFKYDYTPTIYFDRNTPVKFICSKHGLVEQTPMGHLRKNSVGCPICGKELSSKNKIETTKKNYIDFLISKYGNKFDYSITEYKGINTKIKVKCNTCGSIITKSPFKKINCFNCYLNSITKSTEAFKLEIERIFGKDTFDLSKVEYRNARKPVIVKCLKCGREFLKTPGNMLKGKGCKYCKIYKGEKAIELYLNKIDVGYNRYKKYPDLKDVNPLDYDFYIEKDNLLIEYNGIQHYEFNCFFHKNLHDFHRQLHHDWLKRKYAKDNDINLLVIPYWQFDEIEDILSSIYV